LTTAALDDALTVLKARIYDGPDEVYRKRVARAPAQDPTAAPWVSS
jgi:hypothetical protein